MKNEFKCPSCGTLMIDWCIGCGYLPSNFIKAENDSLEKKSINPLRIQRSRKRKQVSPNGLPIIYVGRPTKWGNPWAAAPGAEKAAVSMFKQKVDGNIEFQKLIKLELKGKNLSCWCSLECTCHADVLLEVANS